MIGGAALSLWAAKPAATPRSSTGNMTLKDNIESPMVQPKNHAAVERKMLSIQRWYTDRGLSAKTTRNGEVVMVSVPLDELFAPGSVTPMAYAEQVLVPFRDAIERGESFRLVVAVHADDTGDHTYSDNLTQQRADAIKGIFDSMAARSGVKPNIDYYSMGKRKNAVPNNSIANRAQNRRLEIYVVPEAKAIGALR